MDAKKLAHASKPDTLSTYLMKQPMSMAHHGGGHAESIRRAEHKGHQIVIRTTYEIQVDGRTIPVPLGVDNDGHVHCHSLPNYQFTSAIDMVKQLIDSFPKDFARGGRRPPVHGPSMPHHEGMHMSRRRRKATR